MYKTKAYAYIIRSSNQGTKFLVFTQQGHPEAGVQIPGGTIDEGESPQSALIREIEEESGLANLTDFEEIGTIEYFHPQKKELHFRHFFVVKAPRNVPESWSHTVTSGINDSGLVFNYFWIKASETSTLAGEQGIFAHRIE